MSSTPPGPPSSTQPRSSRATRLGRFVVPGKGRFRRLRRKLYGLWGRPLPRLRLSHQMIGFFVVVVLIPLLFLSWSIYRINQKAVKKQVAHFTERTAQATYEALRQEMHWQAQSTTMAAQYWSLVLSTRGETAQQALLNTYFQQNPDTLAVVLYDSQGQRFRTFLPTAQLQSGFKAPITSTAQGSNTVFQVSYQADSPIFTNSGHYHLTISQPLDVNGVSRRITLIKRFPFLDELLSDRLKLYRNGFFVVDQTGHIIAGPPSHLGQMISQRDKRHFDGLPEGSVREYANNEAGEGKKEDGQVPFHEADKVLIKMPKLGWGLVFESPYHIQRQYIERARAQSVALVFLGILLIVLLGLLYSRGINRNFRQLLKGIKALAEGRYSRRIRLITKTWTPYEVVYLTAEINRMASKISTAWSDIQKLNQELVYKNQQDVFIAQATQRLHSSLERETVCQSAVDILVAREDLLWAGLYLNEPLELVSVASAVQPGIAPDLQTAICTLHGAECWITDVTQTQVPKSIPMPEALKAVCPKGRLFAQPVTYQAQPLGVLLLLEATDMIHDSDHAMVLTLLAGQIGVALYQARQWQQLQQANIQLAKLDELKSNLIDTVSHELRTPLTNIKGYTSRLIRYEDTLDAQTKIKSLKIIKQQTDRLTRLVEDLLVIPDLEREGGIRVYPDRVDLDELVDRSVAFITEKAARDIRVSKSSPSHLALVDPDRMEQVLLNLLDNAVKYGYPHEAIEVSLSHAADQSVLLEVFNPCDPLNPEELASLFTKFRRLDERMTRTTRGTGLGLFITKGLVQAMGGNIGILGDGGFRVQVFLPAWSGMDSVLAVVSSQQTSHADYREETDD